MVIYWSYVESGSTASTYSTDPVQSRKKADTFLCEEHEPHVQLVVVLPLFDDNPEAAAASLIARLESWHLAPPCENWRPASRALPTLVAAWGGRANHSSKARAKLQDVLADRVQHVRGCFAGVELFSLDQIAALVPAMPLGDCADSCGEDGVVIKEAGVHDVHGRIGGIGSANAVGGYGRSWGLMPAHLSVTLDLTDSFTRSSARARPGDAISEDEMFLAMLTHARNMVRVHRPIALAPCFARGTRVTCTPLHRMRQCSGWRKALTL